MEMLQEMPRKGVVYNYGYASHFKTEYISVDFFLPLTKENATGMSLLAGVLSRGCRKFPGMDRISRYLAKNYGASLSISASKAGEMESLTFSFSFLDRKYAIDGEDIRAAVVELFRALVFDPLLEGDGFRADYVEQEKKNLADKIAGLFNDKRVWALERCKGLMCAEEAFGIGENGDLETLEAFDPQSLYAFFQKVLKEAWVFAGYVGKDRAFSLESLLSDLSARETEMPQTAVVPFGGKLKEIEEPMDLSQSKLTMGFRMGEAALENSAAARLFNVLFGGSATSKLFMNVRERLSLCYYCSSRLYRMKNVMFVASGIQADKYEQARSEIERQLAAVAQGDFSEEELENARIYLIDSYRSMNDNQSALSSLMLTGTLHNALRTPEQEIEAMKGVSREEVIAVAKDVCLDTVYFLKGVHHEGE